MKLTVTYIFRLRLFEARVSRKLRSNEVSQTLPLRNADKVTRVPDVRTRKFIRLPYSVDRVGFSLIMKALCEKRRSKDYLDSLTY